MLGVGETGGWRAYGLQLTQTGGVAQRVKLLTGKADG